MIPHNPPTLLYAAPITLHPHPHTHALFHTHRKFFVPNVVTHSLFRSQQSHDIKDWVRRGGGTDNSNFGLYTYTATLNWLQYDSVYDYFRITVEYIYLIMTVITMYYEIFSWYAAIKQDADKTVWSQIATGWNFFDMVVYVFNILVIFAFLYIQAMAPAATRNPQAPFDSWNPGQCALRYYTVWLYVAGLNTVLQGLQLMSYMQFHPGLRIYAQLIARSTKYLKDFLAFLVYLFLGLAFGSLGLAKSSGGPLDFIFTTTALSSITRLTFGFYDFSDFINNYQGMGTFGVTRELWFWLCVVMNVIVVQNITLAIIGRSFEDAVEEQAETHPEPYDAFLTTSVKRAKFAVKWRVLRYIFRIDIMGNKCLPSDGSTGWFTKQERGWILCKTKWARRLLVFFTDQTHGEIVYAEQWTRLIEIDAQAAGGIRSKVFERTRSIRSHGVSVSQDDIGSILNGGSDKIKKLERKEFEKVLAIAVRPEVYPMYNDVLQAHFGTRLRSFGTSGAVGVCYCVSPHHC